MQLDTKQQEVARYLTELATIIGKKPKFFDRSEKRAGLYLHGGIGIGKSMLMKIFFQKVNAPKIIIHFQEFMKELHMTYQRCNNNIHQSIEEVIRGSKLLCIDEFEVQDIADAMLIRKLLEYISTKTFLFITTNTQPDDLYKDGLQRESFLPAIRIIKEKFKIIHLDTKIDYRSTDAKPCNYDNQLQIIKSKLITHPTHINIFGRKIFFQNSSKNILLTNFNELFARNLSYVDYVEICKRFNIIIIQDIRQIKDDETNLAIRFINFIDNAYFYSILVFLDTKLSFDKIYINGKKMNEFKRSISRLNEMSQYEYINQKCL